MLAGDAPRRRVQVARPAVIAKAGPLAEHLILIRRRQCRQVGKAGQKTLVIGDDGFHLGLLQHDFGQPDRIGIALRAALPGQIVAAMPLLPGDQARGELGAGNRDHFAAGSSCSSLSMTAFTAASSHSMAVFTE